MSAWYKASRDLILMYMLWFIFILGLNFISLCFGVWKCMIMSLKQREIKFKPGLSSRARAGDFPRLLREWPPATFIGKWKKNRTKRNPKPFDSPPTCCIHPATWNLSDNPVKPRINLNHNIYNVQYRSKVSYQSCFISCATRIASCSTLRYPLVSSGQISETCLCNIVEFPKLHLHGYHVASCW